MTSFFQNKEYIIPYAQVTHVVKYPPDRLEIGTTSGEMISIINTEDCGLFIKGYAAFLNS